MPTLLSHLLSTHHINIQGFVSGAVTSTAALVGSATKGVAKGVGALSGDKDFVRQRDERRRYNTASSGGVLTGGCHPPAPPLTPSCPPTYTLTLTSSHTLPLTPSPSHPHTPSHLQPHPPILTHPPTLTPSLSYNFSRTLLPFHAHQHTLSPTLNLHPSL